MSGDGFDIRTLAATYHARTTLAAHCHRWGQLVFAASGVVRVTTDDAVWLIPPTRAIWLPAGVRHAITMQGEVAMRTLYIDVPLVRKVMSVATRPRTRIGCFSYEIGDPRAADFGLVARCNRTR